MYTQANGDLTTAFDCFITVNETLKMDKAGE